MQCNEHIPPKHLHRNRTTAEANSLYFKFFSARLKMWMIETGFTPSFECQFVSVSLTLETHWVGQQTVETTKYLHVLLTNYHWL